MSDRIYGHHEQLTTQANLFVQREFSKEISFFWLPADVVIEYLISHPGYRDDDGMGHTFATNLKSETSDEITRVFFSLRTYQLAFIRKITES